MNQQWLFIDFYSKNSNDPGYFKNVPAQTTNPKIPIASIARERPFPVLVFKTYSENFLRKYILNEKDKWLVEVA